jgi:chromosome segregation protein
VVWHVVLKRLTITGFKSFANKTVLDFESGMTAIVGPNGSGKSNVSDAIRWAMGEQSKGKLRLKDREEVVFSGTEKRARASFAEVIMLFDNQSGVFPLDATEVELSRRLYRSGESDFRLNGRSIRFNEVAALLAEAGFGRDSYAVVGQGMIDNLLISSPVERKLLFEEAAGIRGFELKRAESVKRLNASDANIVRLKDIQNEIQPHLERLKEAMKAADRRNELATKIQELRQRLVDAETHEIEVSGRNMSDKKYSLTALTAELRHDQVSLQADIAAIRDQAQSQVDAQAKALTELSILESERDSLSVTIAEHQIQLAEYLANETSLAVETRRLDVLCSDLKKLETKLADYVSELETNAKAASRIETALIKANSEIKRAEDRLIELRGRTADGSQRQYVDHALGLVKIMAQQLSTNDEVSLSELRLLVHKTGRLLSYASKSGELDILEELKVAQLGLEALMRRRETSLEHQSNITLSRRSLELDRTFHRDELSRIEVESKQLEASIAKLDTSAAQIMLTNKMNVGMKRFSQLNTQLAEQRSRLSTRAIGIDADEQARKTAELERVKAKLENTISQMHELESRATALKTTQAKLVVRLHTWSLIATAKSGSIHELERDLATTEAIFEAESSHVAGVEVEFNETASRADELAEQLRDLESAQANLREVIVHLDSCIRERFEINFAGISEHFNRSFARLFDGGSAGLKLERDEESGDYGILIKVNPKGKRLSSLEVLSGGERALAGVALLAAILEVNPSPFIVLDEIDAALDEANSGRLATILRELSSKSQLIVITHNRQTMEAAKVLFGVSMNDHHVSHLLSLRLEDAAQLAAR